MEADLSLNLHADALATVAMAKSSEETRYNLNGVFVTPWKVENETGVMMVATDGHILAMYFDPDGEASRSAIIDGNFASSLLKSRASERKPRRISVHGDTGRIFATGDRSNTPKAIGLMLVNEVHGEFPDWERVSEMPEGTPSQTFTWSHLIFDRIAKMGNRLNGLYVQGMDVFMPVSFGPTLFTFGAGCPLSVVAMPMRGGDARASLGWTNRNGAQIESVSKPEPQLAAE